MIIRKADTNDYQAVRLFYFAVIDGFEGKAYHPKWEKDVYPDPEQLKSLIQKGDMYIALDDEKIISAMAFNHEGNDGYEKIKWQVEADRNEVFIIHMLGVHPDHNRRGVAKKMVQFCIEQAKEHGGKAIRLDVLYGNIPANRLYESFGFKKLETVTMFYPDTGYTDFELYELIIE